MLAERRGRTLTGECRVVTFEQAARLHGKAAEGLTKAGLPVYAVHNLCRQAILLAATGVPVEDLLVIAAHLAESQEDPRARAIVLDTRVLTSDSRESAAGYLRKADELWNRLHAVRSPLFTTDLERFLES